MATYPNFYENLEEALMRLRSTVVLYDGEPMHILSICSHMPDGHFRVYMVEVEDATKVSIPILHSHPHGHPGMGPMLDQYVDGTQPSKVKIIRKKMESKYFNNFRPFPLGMLNQGGDAYYLERKPLRPKTEQGLTPAMIDATIMASGFTVKANINVYTSEFRDCVIGNYPSPKECLKGLNEHNTNNSVAFNRYFALVKGPIDSMFLAYKNEIVASLVNRDFSVIKISSKHMHLKEVIQELRLFVKIENQ